MSTDKTTTSQNTYAPGALQNYQQWAGQLFPQLSQMFSNPTKSPFFNQKLQQNQKAAGQTSGLQTKNALANFSQSGIGGGTLGGGAYQSLLAGLGRNSSQNAYSAWNSTMNNANQNMWNAGSLGSSFFGNPLVTGGSQKQQTGGLGTWLPQVIGAGLSLGTGLAGGGLGGATSGAFNMPAGMSAGTGAAIANAPNTGFIGGLNTSMPSGGASSFMPSGTNPFLTGAG